jgi:hypothetical protein
MLLKKASAFVPENFLLAGLMSASVDRILPVVRCTIWCSTWLGSQTVDQPEKNARVQHSSFLRQR